MATLPGSSGPAAAAAALAALFLVSFNTYLAFVLPIDAADVTRRGSSILDMDVQRVVVDLTTELEGYRTSVHPLQKLFLAPAGMTLNAWVFDGADRLGAARLLIGGSMTLQALLVGWLVWCWTDRAVAPAIAAGLTSGLSFSTALAVSIPESAAFSGLATLAPLVFLQARIGRGLPWWESLVWGLIGVLCIGLTITQLVHWVIAVGVRATLLCRAGAMETSALMRRLAVSAVLLVAVTAAAVELQSAWFPGTSRFYAENPIAGERPFFRTVSLTAEPFRHTLRLALHFAVLDFVPPFPGYSDFLIRDYGFDYWSLSIEEAGFERWSALQLLLAAGVLAAFATGCWALRKADVRLLAPCLCVASQFGLHLLYGREYILYSPSWHGVLVAVLVAAAWNAVRRRWGVVAVCGALCAGMLVNDVAVLNAVYREVAAGLAIEVRDMTGALLRR